MERRHVTPSSIGVARIGHFGAFRPEARALWEQTAAWMAAITAS